MRNQRSWRLLTEIEPNDSNIQVSKVIWKVDENWDSFYPYFDWETTVVFMSDDKKTFETCKATADWLWGMTLTKRWLSDDVSETEVAAFKKDWLPWTYMFATMWAWDLISLNEDNTWKWDQTYQWDLIVDWNFELSGDFNMETEWDVSFVTEWAMTFQDKDVWPVTLAQMIQQPLSWSAIDVMTEEDFEDITTPSLNTAYIRHETGETKLKKMYFNGSDYDMWWEVEWPMIQDDYDDLPSSKLTDWKYYLIYEE